ncbi:MAG: hypothetical protein AAB229_01025, partial [Candidatus Hydrogenedentota bacterium]
RIRENSGDAIGTTYSKPFDNIDGFDLGSVDITSDRLRYGNIGFSFSQLRVAGIREAANGVLTGNLFDARMDAVRLSFAPRRSGVSSRFGYGAQINYVGFSVRDRSRSRFGLDLGADYTWKSALFTVNLRNLSTNRGDADALPITGELRGEWSPYSLLHLGGGLTWREDGSSDFQIGAEYELFEFLSIMGGYQDASRQWTAGGVVRYNNIALEYGLAAHRELDFTHTVSLGVKF